MPHNVTTTIKVIKRTVLAITFSLFVFSCEEEVGFDFGEGGISNSGSIAMFYIDQQYLYVISQDGSDNTLSIFNVSEDNAISITSQTSISNDVETISKLGDVLYLGTTTGVLFYDVADPNNPYNLSTYEHVTGCDPVVSDGEYAYTTLRSGRTCGGGTDFLDIIDISNIESPQLVNSIQLTSPYGLAIVGDNLFVGEKENGMHWYNVKDKKEIIEIAYFEDIKAIDFIPNGDNNLIINTEGAILQYSYEGEIMTFISQLLF